MATATCLAVKLPPEQHEQRRLEVERLYEQQFWTKWERDESGRAIRSRHRQQPADTADVPEIEKLIHGDYYPKCQPFPSKKKKNAHRKFVDRNIMKYSRTKHAKALTPSDATSSAALASLSTDASSPCERLYEQLRWANHRRKPRSHSGDQDTSHLTAGELLYSRAQPPASYAHPAAPRPPARPSPPRPSSAPTGPRPGAPAGPECEPRPSSIGSSRRWTSLAAAIACAREHRSALHRSLQLAAAAAARPTVGAIRHLAEEEEEEDGDAPKAQQTSSSAPKQALQPAEVAAVAAGPAFRHAMQVHVPRFREPRADTLRRPHPAHRARTSSQPHQRPLIASYGGSTFTKDGSIQVATHNERQGSRHAVPKGVHRHPALYG
eukprot:EG_transcript_14109